MKKIQDEPFDLQKWLERESANDKIMPREYFPDSSNHPFFKRKLEEVKEYYSKNPLPKQAQ